MKIVATTKNYTEDFTQRLTITADGEEVLDFCDGEPEDNNLSRNFADCFKILELVRNAYEAGRKGEPLEIEEVSRAVSIDDDDDDIEEEQDEDSNDIGGNL